MSTDQPPPAGDQPPRDPFGKQSEGSEPPQSWGPRGGSESPPPGQAPPYGTPPSGGPGQRPHDPYGSGQGYPGYGQDPLAGMPPLAHRGKRLLARIIDALIIGIPLGVIMYFAFGNYRYDTSLRSFWQELIYALVYFAYDGYMLTSRGQTFGKMLMKIRVAMLDSGATPVGQPGWTRAAVYALPPVVPCCGAVFWLVNVAWCLWDRPYHQCLHDKAAKTVVVAVQD